MPEDRRTLLKVLTGGIGGCAALAVGLPTLRALLAPVGKQTVAGAGEFVPIATPDLVPKDGTPLRRPVVIRAPRDAWTLHPATEIGAVYLRKSGPEIIAYSTVCPHLGCGIDYAAERQHFACPCHESAFDLEGEVSGGPSPRGLDRLDTRIVDGKVEVRYARFKQGTKDKVPA